MTRPWPAFDPQVTPAAPGDVEAFEKRFNVTLPDDYRDFLLTSNGGGTVDERCNYGGPIINSMLSLNPPPELDTNDLVEWNERVRKDLKAKDVLVVGYDGMGGLVLLGVGGAHDGEVWLQESEGPSSRSRAKWHDRRDMQKLAASFHAFMDSLGPL